MTMLCGLNPFDIRASVRTALSSGLIRGAGLNPFDIRASVRTLDPGGATPRKCLNPFDIRASVRTISRRRMAPLVRVSIPLISGHQSGRNRLARSCACERLNPFDIRASVRTDLRPQTLPAQVVSIPLISGHQSGLFWAESLDAAQASQSL